MNADWLKELGRSYRNSPEGVAHELQLSFAETVIDRLRELGWSQKRVCEKLKVSEPLISRLLSGDHNWTVESAGAILWALGIRARVSRHHEDAAVIRLENVHEAAAEYGELKELMRGKKDNKTTACAEVIPFRGRGAGNTGITR